MATDINLNNLTWDEPNQIRNFSDNKALVKWALQFLRVEENWLVLRPFSCSKAELKLLSDAVGEIPQLKYDFQSATSIFFHLRNFHRFQADEIEELNTAIKDKDNNMEVILRSYFPNTTAECVYKVFTLWL